MLEGRSLHANAKWTGERLTFGVADEVQAFAIFGKPPVSARVRYILGTGEVGITIEGGEYDGKQTLIGVGQIVGTDEYHERIN